MQSSLGLSRSQMQAQEVQKRQAPSAVATAASTAGTEDRMWELANNPGGRDEAGLNPRERSALARIREQFPELKVAVAGPAGAATATSGRTATPGQVQSASQHQNAYQSRAAITSERTPPTRLYPVSPTRSSLSAYSRLPPDDQLPVDAVFAKYQETFAEYDSHRRAEALQAENERLTAQLHQVQQQQQELITGGGPPTATADATALEIPSALTKPADEEDEETRQLEAEILKSKGVLEAQMEDLHHHLSIAVALDLDIRVQGLALNEKTARLEALRRDRGRQN